MTDHTVEHSGQLRLAYSWDCLCVQVVASVLEQCGNDIEEAIRQLGQLRLSQVQQENNSTRASAHPSPSIQSHSTAELRQGEAHSFIYWGKFQHSVQWSLNWNTDGPQKCSIGSARISYIDKPLVWNMPHWLLQYCIAEQASSNGAIHISRVNCIS